MSPMWGVGAGSVQPVVVERVQRLALRFGGVAAPQDDEGPGGAELVREIARHLLRGGLLVGHDEHLCKIR